MFPGLEVLVPYPMNVVVFIIAIICGLYIFLEK